ncbi:MAG: BrnA antitoxin family protein [Ancalomicrobiaceae bacterium]|nr:BrnA antitoxin family protein [Ancalomicrobiaceae bacterium]
MSRPPSRHRPLDAREAAEQAFKAATTKQAPPLPETPRPVASRPAAPPNAREMVTLRIERAVLDFYQAEGPGWQDRMHAALKKAAGLE